MFIPINIEVRSIIIPFSAWQLAANAEQFNYPKGYA